MLLTRLQISRINPRVHAIGQTVRISENIRQYMLLTSLCKCLKAIKQTVQDCESNQSVEVTKQLCNETNESILVIDQTVQCVKVISQYKLLTRLCRCPNVIHYHMLFSRLCKCPNIIHKYMLLARLCKYQRNKPV